VLLAVSVSAARMAFLQAGEQPNTAREEIAPWPEYRIVDRNGDVLAMSVESFDVSASPQSLWRAHTPRRIAARLAPSLELEPEDVLMRLMPHEAADDGGWLVPEKPELIRLDGAAMARALDWFHDGAPLGVDGHGPLDGIGLVALPGLAQGQVAVDGAGWTVRWRPDILLSEELRLEHLGKDRAGRPDLWANRLLRHLGQVLELIDEDGRVILDRLPGHLASDLATDAPADRRAGLYDALWAELMPCTHRVVDRNVAAIYAEALRDALDAEGVSSWQVQLTPRNDRRHPHRPGGFSRRPMGEGEPDPADAFSMVGHWGVLGPVEADRRASFDLGARPHLLEWESPADPLDAYTSELLSKQRPWSGLELLCGDILAETHWKETLVVRPRRYQHKSRTLARDRRVAWEKGRVPDYFSAFELGVEEPTFEVTLDAELQGILHDELSRLIVRTDAALVMGICVEVESGEVLAVDAVNGYSISGFAPTQHRFTPGSTFKPLIMATGIETERVQPLEEVQCFGEKGIVLRDGRSARAIGEAEGVPDAGPITATWALAKSVNAVLVQIGMRVPAHEMRAFLEGLGYGARPGAGIGPEVGGYLPALTDGTWSSLYTHASVCFGHELAVTLWQHAAGLASLARGGEYRQLSLVRAIHQEGDRHELEPTPLNRVFSQKTCDEVLAMMAVGAEEGTGRHVAAKDDVPELEWIGTKTGTTEKTKTEVCLHEQFSHRQDHREDGTSCPRACREAALKPGVRQHKMKCYTSSMCAVGRLPEGKDVMVFIVVEEPRKGGRFGSDIAGPTTIRVLRRALGLAPKFGTPIIAPLSPTPSAPTFDVAETPWLDDIETGEVER
jgi:cell division protein FtsI/penicillin-binding protein 2